MSVTSSSVDAVKSLETAPTESIESSGIRFAYRRLGTRNGTPLILLQHFSGNMDSWDPAVVDADWCCNEWGELRRFSRRLRVVTRRDHSCPASQPAASSS